MATKGKLVFRCTATLHWSLRPTKMDRKGQDGFYIERIDYKVTPTERRRMVKALGRIGE